MRRRRLRGVRASDGPRVGERPEKYRRERQREREECVHVYAIGAPVYVRVGGTGADARWWGSWRRRTALFKRVRGAEDGVAASRRILRTMQVAELPSERRGTTARAAIACLTTYSPHLLPAADSLV